MSLTGTIGTISLSGLLQLLSNEQNTGVLSVKQSDMEFQIFFLDGNVVYATESRKVARLGELLINDAHVTSAQMKTCLKESVKKKQAIGKTLVENKIITKEILEKYLYIQVQEIIFTLFCMNEGTFRYKNTKFDMRWLMPVEINTLRLVMEALQRLDDNAIEAFG
jgi:Domain of unknown function (DUF4388)